MIPLLNAALQGAPYTVHCWRFSEPFVQRATTLWEALSVANDILVRGAVDTHTGVFVYEGTKYLHYFSLPIVSE